MSLAERYGTRDLTYSKWHRPPSIRRYLDDRTATDLSWIDIDCCEYCERCKEPLALLELAQDVGQSTKPTVVTKNLAIRARISAYLVFYKVLNGDIVSFRLRQIAPRRNAEKNLTPAQFAVFLAGLRKDHKCYSSGE